SAVTPVKTGVQSVRKALKTLDSGFRRNDAKRNQIDFFTPSGRVGWGWLNGSIRLRFIPSRHAKA
ncbi:MAG TPA: hypothetical protein VF372_01320, partial [Thermodesulfobacteriota bacterium]